MPIEILEIFTPILHELEELNQDLNFEEFLDAAEKLLQTLSVTEKAKIFNSKKNSYNSNPNITFKVFFFDLNKKKKDLIFSPNSMKDL